LLKDLLKQRALIEYKQLAIVGNQANIGGRNLTKNFNDSINEEDCTDSGHAYDDNQLMNMTTVDLLAKSNSNPTIEQDADGLLTKQILRNNDRLRKTYEENLYNNKQLPNDQKRYIVEYPTAAALIFYEIPVKRKCIMKNSVKPHFSQWHSYWCQLVGNVLIYYSSKLSLLPTSTPTHNPNSTGSTTSSHQQQQQQPKTSLGCSSSSINSDYSMECVATERKNYHKDPCKMHTIANWMVVALFQVDDLNHSTVNMVTVATPSPSNVSSCSNSSTCSSDSAKTTCIGVKRKKYDVQLTDLNNGKKPESSLMHTN
jgi:hypothetical protein